MKRAGFAIVVIVLCVAVIALEIVLAVGQLIASTRACLGGGL